MGKITRLLCSCLVALLLLPVVAHAGEDPPGRVGRLSSADGRVSWYDDEEGQWAPAQRNRPLTAGDRLSTDGDARAEVRIGSTVLRLGGGTELEFERLDDERIGVRLHAGSLALRVRSREKADELDVLTGEAVLQPLRSGHYRIDRVDDATWAGVWRGEMRIDDRDEGFTIGEGRRVELWREGRLLRHAWTSTPDDEFADWVAREDRRDQRSATYRYVSPEMTGAEELDDHGRWEAHPEYGHVWVPIAVAPGWAPYRYGRWAWVRPWGWTWVDEAPWGFAPFHYGRWVWWGSRWAWTPGPYVARPVYAPALVAWVGGGSFSVSVSVGPTVGWLPLAPFEPFVPYYRHSPRYHERVNPHPPGRRHPPQVPTGPIMYSNQGVPGAVTVVPRDALQRREPVSRAVIDLRGPVRQPLPVLREAPEPVARAVQPIARPVPAPPMRVQPVRPAPVVREPSPVAPDPVRRPPTVIDTRPTAPERVERPVRVERPERVERVERPDRPERVERPAPPPAAQVPAPPVQRVQPLQPVQPVQPVQPIQPVQPAPQRPQPMPAPPQMQPRPVQPAQPPQVAPPQRGNPRDEAPNPGRGNTRERNELR